MINDTQLKDLNDLYLEIEHNTLVDGEVTLNGNGTNSHEASNVICAVFDVLGLDHPEVTKQSFTEFCEYHGCDLEDYEDVFENLK